MEGRQPVGPVRFNLQHSGALSMSWLSAPIAVARLRILKKKFFCWTHNGVLRYARVFEISCIDGEFKNFPPVKLEGISIALNGKRAKEWEFDFFSCGQVRPEGILLFSQGPLKDEWKISEILLREEGEKQGPCELKF